MGVKVNATLDPQMGHYRATKNFLTWHGLQSQPVRSTSGRRRTSYRRWQFISAESVSVLCRWSVFDLPVVWLCTHCVRNDVIWQLQGSGGGASPHSAEQTHLIFSLFLFLLFLLIQFSIGCLHHSHNANHSWSLFMCWLICKVCPSSSNSQQRRNITASRVVLNLSLRTDLYFLIQNWEDMNLWIINQNPPP